MAAVPGTIGCQMILTKKGEDNVFKFVGSRAELIAEFGEPNIQDFGKNYGQGMYNSYNYLGESGALFVTRCMPDDAAFANIRIDAVMDSTSEDATLQATYITSANASTTDELKTGLVTSGDTQPVCVIRPIGRGEYYNSLSVRFTEHSNPLLNGVYVMDIYEKQSDGTDVIVESFEVSFDPNAKDLSGDSIFICYILAQYSSMLRAEMKLASEEYSDGYKLVSKVYDKEIGTVSAVTTSGSATIADTKQDFSDWEGTSDPKTYVVIAKDAKGNVLYGWLGAAIGTDSDEVAVYDSRLAGGTQAWVGDTSSFDENSEITYEIKKSASSIATAFASADPVPMKKGTDGSLLNSVGDVDSVTATQLLSQGYLGQLTSKVDGSTAVDDILDTENSYFSLVFDAGYPSDVKTQIVTLCQTRKDCVAILDNGDNNSVNASLDKRNNTHTYNTYLAAMYESFNKVYDTFTGQDVWFSPVYHMSYLLPRNDNVAEVWYAAAGFNRAAIQNIKELRFNPKLGQRDQMYLKQLNPIVKFNPGYTVWGQLTTQARASALQDLNIVRLVLYCKRALELYCRYFTFEQNDAITWSKVQGNVVEFLDDIKKRRGLDSYNVSVGATAYERKRKTFHVDVTLEPTRVVEKIELNFFIK